MHLIWVRGSPPDPPGWQSGRSATGAGDAHAQGPASGLWATQYPSRPTSRLDHPRTAGVISAGAGTLPTTGTRQRLAESGGRGGDRGHVPTPRAGAAPGHNTWQPCNPYKLVILHASSKQQRDLLHRSAVLLLIFVSVRPVIFISVGDRLASNTLFGCSVFV